VTRRVSRCKASVCRQASISPTPIDVTSDIGTGSGDTADVEPGPLTSPIKVGLFVCLFIYLFLVSWEWQPPGKF